MDSVEKNGYVGTILLDIAVGPKYFTDDGSKNLENCISTILTKRFGKLCFAFIGKPSPIFGRIILLVNEKGVSIMIRTYPIRSHLTCTIEYDVKEFKGKAPLDFKEISGLESELVNELQGFKKTYSIPEVKRALDFDVYFTTSDYRLLEYDFEEMLFNEKSEFQNVQIARSTNYGNVLILDGYVNLAESDLVYTETIMCRGRVDYSGKDVLILGGGDGGLLNELRKENTRSITMIEIDPVVMKGCKVHLRGACGDTLDNFKHENYEIIVGDCIPFMEDKCKKEGLMFDYIFGDLTDIPISMKAEGEVWDFFRNTLQLSFSILKPEGSYFTHANGVTAGEKLKMFEETIRASLDFPLDFKTSSAFIPSFMEKWIFYQVKRA